MKNINSLNSSTNSINKSKKNYLDTLNYRPAGSKRRNSTSILINQFLSPDNSSLVKKPPKNQNNSYSYEIDGIEYRKCISTGNSPKRNSPVNSNLDILSGSFTTEKPKHVTITTLPSTKFKLSSARSLFSSSLNKKRNSALSSVSSNFCFNSNSFNCAVQKRHSISVFKFFSKRYSSGSDYYTHPTLEFAYNQLSTQALALAHLPLATVSNKNLLEINSLISSQYNSYQNIDSLTSTLEISIANLKSMKYREPKSKNRSKSTPIKSKSAQCVTSSKKKLGTLDTNDKSIENNSVVSNFASTCSLYNKYA